MPYCYGTNRRFTERKQQPVYTPPEPEPKRKNTKRKTKPRGTIHPHWTTKEESWLADNYQRLGPDACAEHLKRSPSAVKHHAKKMGIASERVGDRYDEAIIARWNMPCGEAAQEIGCTRQKVYSRRHHLRKTLEPETIAALDAKSARLREPSAFERCISRR